MKSTLAILSVCLLLFRTGECITFTLPAGGDQIINLNAADTTIATLTSSGASTGGTVTYSITGQSTADTFQIATATITLKTGKSLSTTIPNHLLDVSVTDTPTGGGAATTVTGKLYISVNTANPAFCVPGYCVPIPATLAINSIIGTYQATDSDAGTTLTYSLSTTSPLFAIKTATGVVTAKLAIATTHDASYTIILHAKDTSATKTGSTTVTILRGGTCPSASDSGATVLSAAVMTTAGTLAMLFFF